MDLGNLASLNYFLPELLLTAGVILLVVVDLIVRDKSSLGDMALIITAGALVLIAIEPAQRGAWLFHRMLVFDAFAVFFRAFASLATAGSLFNGPGYALCDGLLSFLCNRLDSGFCQGAGRPSR